MPYFYISSYGRGNCYIRSYSFFIDVELDTFNISIDSLKKGIQIVKKENKYKPKAIIAVDLYGLPANYDELNIISRENNLSLISDAAQSFGAELNSNKVGVLADITCISFFPAKPLGCYGDGGAVLTNNLSIQEKVKSLRAHGKGKSKYDIDYVGLNSRLDTIQAGILLAKLEEFDWEIEQRNVIAKNYSEVLNNKIIVPKVLNNYKSVWAQYTLRHLERDKIQKLLNEKGIPTMVYYPIPMHKQKAYRNYYNVDITLDNSEKLAEQVFSLPIYPDLSENEQEYISSELLKIMN